MSCIQCKSIRVASLGAKSNDCNFIRIGNAEKDGYVPGDMGIGAGDYIEFKWCLNCGRIQDSFPLPPSQLETGDEEDEVDEQDDGDLFDPITGRLRKYTGNLRK